MHGWRKEGKNESVKRRRERSQKWAKRGRKIKHRPQNLLKKGAKIQPNRAKIDPKGSQNDPTEISKINQNLERIGSEVYLDLYPDNKDANLPVTRKFELIHAANISQKFKKKTTANQVTKAITENFKTTGSYTEKSSTGKTTLKSTLSTEKAEEFEDIKEQFYIG